VAHAHDELVYGFDDKGEFALLDGVASTKAAAPAKKLEKADKPAEKPASKVEKPKAAAKAAAKAKKADKKADKAAKAAALASDNSIGAAPVPSNDLEDRRAWISRWKCLQGALGWVVNALPLPLPAPHVDARSRSARRSEGCHCAVPALCACLDTRISGTAVAAPWM